MSTGHPSNNQGAMAAQVAAADKKIKDKENARIAAQKIAQEKARVQQLNDSIQAIVKNQLNPANDAMKAAEKEVSIFTKALKTYKAEHELEVGFPTLDDTAAMNVIISQRDSAHAELALQKATIKDINSRILKITKQIISLPPGKQYLLHGPYLNGDGKKKAFSKDYKYNAPMVKSAYFGSHSFQDNILGNNRVDPGAYTDARSAWSGVTGGRGTIQMDKKVLQTMEPQLNTQSDELDTTKYGFKFLYNPTTVSMAWGLMNYMDPPYEAAGLDAFAPVSAGLMTSTIDFELILNRIEDFNYLNENGLSGVSPYAVDVTSGDLKSIYRKGTMYDMEYLMKTLNGPSAQFKSELNGTTSDRSWLRPTIVELHLGSALRYRVRIANLSINHIMFNSRMVPILSSVKISCSRFNDGPTAMKTNSIATSGRVTNRGD